MTFDDDFCRLHLDSGSVDMACATLGFEWPPPERFDLNGLAGQTLVRVSMSKITDAQRAQMTHVARGAQYYYEFNLKTKQ